MCLRTLEIRVLKYSQQTFVLKTSLVFVFKRRLQDVLKTSWSRRVYSPYSFVFRTSSRRLHQHQYISLGYMSSRRLPDVFKTSSRRLAKTSSRRLQDVFKTSSRHLRGVFKIFWKRLQDVFKTFSRRRKDIFEASSRSFKNVFKTSLRHLQDVLKTYYQVKLFLVT